MLRPLRTLILSTGLAACTFAQERPVPPPGVAVPATDKAELQLLLQRLQNSIAGLRKQKGVAQDLIPDVEIFYYAVHYALQYNEFFKPEEIERARAMLKQGESRAEALARGEAPWTTAGGLVVRGYVSKIDNSVQPYGLVVPPTFTPHSPHRWRLDTWFHGRGETLSEVNFLYDRQRNRGEFAPDDAIVLHLYGRYCNGNKFAGEVDLFEALDAVKKHYRIDENRIFVRGFSMGGAATWHIAAHYAGLWAAAAPGAGFAETAEFLNIYKNEKVPPTWWEKKLWHLYDATDYAANFYQLPTVAYSGEIDKQKQAADIMAARLQEEGMTLRHVIGPQTAHKYYPDSKPIIANALDQIAERGRDPYPRKIRFTTWTLAYNQMKWVTIDALGQHWERARLDAEINDAHTITAKTSNVQAFSFQFDAGGAPLDVAQPITVMIDGQKVTTAPPLTDRSWNAHFCRTGTQWAAAPSEQTAGLQKRHNLQGPIDDAFMGHFLMVRPTGQPMVASLDSWVKTEQQHAFTEWRRQFRGEALVKDDRDITDADIASANLILWGDPASNRILARILSKLPLKWTAEGVTISGRTYAANTHVPVLIFPNPLNPQRYVVLNSGFTYREYDYLNNARQVPKLPDYAVIDTSTPPDSRWPGKVVEAGFFNEQWGVTRSASSLR